MRHVTDVTDVTDAPARVRARRVIIVHGFNASPEAHWFPWLRDELAAEGIDVSIVSLPRSSSPDASDWEAAVAAELGVPDAQTWLVGHSLGCITILRVLAALPTPWTLGGLALVAGFTGPLESIPELDTYLESDVDVERIAPSIRTPVVFRSDDDAAVPAATTDALAHRLATTSIVIPGAGHFVSTGGVTTVPYVRDAILEQAEV